MNAHISKTTMAVLGTLFGIAVGVAMSVKAEILHPRIKKSDLDTDLVVNQAYLNQVKDYITNHCFVIIPPMHGPAALKLQCR